MLALPDDIEFGEIVVDPAPFDTGDLGPAQGLGLGQLVIASGAAADVFFLVNGGFDQNFVPNRSAFIGTLAVAGGLP